MNTNHTIYKVLKPFCLISDQKDKVKFWVPKKTKDNTMACAASFDVMAYPLFIDNLAKLEYLSLHSISIVDEDMSYIYLLVNDNLDLERLLDDIAELLDLYVVNYDKRTTVYTGTK